MNTKTNEIEQSSTLNRRRLPAQQRSKVRVERILSAASELLTTISVDRLTTRRISELAKVNIATLYQFFPNKEAIIFALYEKWLGEIDGIISSIETSQFGSNDWRSLFTTTFDALNKTPTELVIKDRLLKAMGMNEDLRQLDHEHSIILSGRLAKLMSNLGSDLTECELQDHAILIFHFERALVAPLANATEEERGPLYEKGRHFLIEMIALAYR